MKSPSFLKHYPRSARSGVTSLSPADYLDHLTTWPPLL
jgi:hypothetical protein